LKIIECDICRKQYGSNLGSMVITDDEYKIKYEDLCEDCSQKIQKYIRDLKNEKENIEPDQPWPRE
jgi:methionine synthase II (cobalamin-independent)